jgi:hypothetical protein
MREGYLRNSNLRNPSPGDLAVEAGAEHGWNGCALKVQNDDMNMDAIAA